MSRIFGLIAVLIVLLVGAVLAKRQLSGIHAAPATASQASTLAVPDVRTPQDARRLTEQVQGEVNQMVEDHDRQLRQNIDSQTP
jgi:hypothetical protein